MLDLQARIHLDEVELAVLVEELDRAGAAVLDLAHGLGDRLADLLARISVERGRGGFLQDLLVAPLQRAVALAEVDGVALAVAEDLDLDVARRGQILLDVDGIVAEGGLGFGARGGESEPQIGGRVGDLHAAAAAAGGRLDQHGETHGLGDLHRLGLAGDGAVGARHYGNAEALCGLLRRDLIAHDADVLGRRPDEGDLVLFEDLGEAGVLRQEAVARMHGVGAGDLAGSQQARNVEIAIGGSRRADANALVSEPHMHGVGVGGRMHRHGGDAQLLARALDAQCNLPPVGDQDLVEHSLLGRGRWAMGSREVKRSTACCLLPSAVLLIR